MELGIVIGKRNFHINSNEIIILFYFQVIVFYIITIIPLLKISCILYFLSIDSSNLILSNCQLKHFNVLFLVT